MFSLSLTCSTLAFYNHEDFKTFDKDSQRRLEGQNDPAMVHILPITFLYSLLNIPKICVNGLILSITPFLGGIMLVVEAILGLTLSHIYIKPLSDNEYTPGGIILGVTNVICPNYPVSKIWVINLISAIFSIIKVSMMYIVLNYFLSLIHISEPTRPY